MLGIINAFPQNAPTVYENAFFDLNLSFLGTAEYVRSLKKLMLFDKNEIVSRQKVFADVIENEELITFFDELCEKLTSIDELSQSRRGAATYSNNESLLYSFRELNIYTDCVDTIIKAGERLSDKVTSEGIKKLFDFAFELKEKEWYKNALRFISDTDEKLRDIKSISLGINLDAQLRPQEAGIVSFNTKPYVSNSILDKLFSEKAESKEYIVMSALCKNEFGLGAQQMSSLAGQVYSALNSIFKNSLVKIKGILQKAEWENGFLNFAADEIRFIKSGADYIIKMRSKGLPLCTPAFSDSDEEIIGLYDPNLASFTKNADIVKNDAVFDENGKIFVLTGKNSGGKSVYLRAVGICYVLFQLGLPIPAKSAKMRLTDGIFTHFIGRSDASVGGRLENECLSISKICHEITPDGLLLMDESFSSTSAYDGALIAEEVLKFLSKKGCRCIYATHIHDVASKIGEINSPESKARVDTLSVNDQNKYKIERKHGEGSSHALEIFKKYGLDLK